MTAVGFEPTQLALVELESTPLDHSGKLSVRSGGCEQVVVRSMLVDTHTGACAVVMRPACLSSAARLSPA